MVALVVVVVVVSRQQYGKITNKDSITVARSEIDRDDGTMNSVKPTRTEVPSM